MENIQRNLRKNRSKISRILMTIMLIIICSYMISEIRIKKETSAYGIKTSATNNLNKNIEVIAESLKKIRKEIDKSYIGKIDEQKMIDEAIKGYVKGVGDKYTEYYTAKEWEELLEQLEGKFFGIGIQMQLTKQEPQLVEIAAVMKDSPAEKSGLMPGDIIAKVNSEEVNASNFSKISEKIKGKEFTKVKLTLLRRGEELEKEIERREIKLESVKSAMLKENIGYIEIISFTEQVDKEFYKKLYELKEKGMNKLILDLRFNGGGELTATENILEAFLPKGKTMYSTVNKNKKHEYIKSVLDKEEKLKVVVLVNGYTASASEVVTGALLDNKIAEVVGEKTYGKGVIQKILPLKNKAALKITVEEYFRPLGEKINGIGIMPTYEIKLDKEDYQKKLEEREKQRPTEYMPILDNQLLKAIEIIKNKN